MRFEYFGEELDGFDHRYNDTIRNERSVEIAIASRWIAGLEGRLSRRPAGLEVGNVLSHYDMADPIGGGTRRTVDLTEIAARVENIDVFDIEGSFDWIISISTMEHVRWDHVPRDESAARRAIEHLRSLLTSTGRMLVTAPGGWHPALDLYLATGAGTTRCSTLRRDGDTWRQTETMTFLPYRMSTPWAESVWIGEWTGGDR